MKKILSCEHSVGNAVFIYRKETVKSTALISWFLFFRLVSWGLACWEDFLRNIWIADGWIASALTPWPEGGLLLAVFLEWHRGSVWSQARTLNEAAFVALLLLMAGGQTSCREMLYVSTAFDSVDHDLMLALVGEGGCRLMGRYGGTYPVHSDVNMHPHC